MDPKITESPGSPHQTEALFDTDIENRNRYRQGIGEIIKVLFSPTPNEALTRISVGQMFQTSSVEECGLLGVGSSGSGFTFRLKDAPHDWRVVKVATYRNDPWLDSRRHEAAGTTESKATPSFCQEIAALLRFEDLPPTPKLYDFGVLHIQGIARPFIVEEEILGKTLADKENPLTQEERARLIFQYLLQLNYIHNQGFVMPDNHIFGEVVYQRDTKPPSIKIIDFEFVQPASVNHRPTEDLDRLREYLYDTVHIRTKRLHERLAVTREPIVTKEFDERFSNGEITTAGDGLLPISYQFPQVAKEIGDNWYRLKNLKPRFSYDPDIIQKLLQNRHINVS